MKQRIPSLVPTLLCVLFLPLCAFFIHPWVEIGVVDDESYIRSAQLLAQTGHIVYNGWATACLGWQLYVGALFIKLFGASLTAPRIGTLIVSLATAGLMQRLLVRMGLRRWSAAAVTLTFLSSATWFAVTFTFMSDVYGMFALLGCLYCCVRALQTANDRHATWWICIAALSNGIGGSARQTAWLGVLVLVPCTLWLLRKNRSALLAGIPCMLLGIATMLWFLHWYSHQPYVIVEHLLPAVTPGMKLLAIRLVEFVIATSFETLLLAMPLLIALAPAVFRQRRAQIAAGIWLLFAAARLTQLAHHHKLFVWEIPYAYNNFFEHGFIYFSSYLGTAPLLITPVMKHLFLLFMLITQVALIATCFSKPASRDKIESASNEPPVGRRLSGYELVVLLGPCVLAYCLLLIPRYVAIAMNLDRYILVPNFVLLFAVVWIYEQRLAYRLPRTAWVTILLFAVFYVAGVRDAFTLFRAQAQILQQTQNAGVPRTAIDGGIQYNTWTQITTVGYLNEQRMQNPSNLYKPMPDVGDNDPCQTEHMELTPVVRAQYVVSFDPNACRGLAPQFAPVHFETIFAPHQRTLYIVKGPAAR
ncbi:ArnT family glycosyltransferase [Granulicella cerasi]|uniref:ArnT family glycosyltransferase n=1 Tax=Granulicella cerasi TaxID=741063 RepID=A0ABW1Z984_9BACT|nr:hypothetical protein [Granulicella cerasi]